MSNFLLCYGLVFNPRGGGGGGIPMMAYTGRLDPKRGTSFRPQVYERARDFTR